MTKKKTFKKLYFEVETTDMVYGEDRKFFEGEFDTENINIFTEKVQPEVSQEDYDSDNTHGALLEMNVKIMNENCDEIVGFTISNITGQDDMKEHCENIQQICEESIVNGEFDFSKLQNLLKNKKFTENGCLDMLMWKEVKDNGKLSNKLTFEKAQKEIDYQIKVSGGAYKFWKWLKENPKYFQTYIKGLKNKE